MPCRHFDLRVKAAGMFVSHLTREVCGFSSAMRPNLWRHFMFGAAVATEYRLSSCLLSAVPGGSFLPRVPSRYR